RVEVEVTLLDVFAVIAFRIGQAEQAFLQDRIAAVPQRDRKAQAALAIAEAEQPVFAPSVGPAAGMVMRKVVPAIAIGGVVLADGAPLALRQIGAPALPIGGPLRVFLQAARLCAEVSIAAHADRSVWIRGARLPGRRIAPRPAGRCRR